MGGIGLNIADACWNRFGIIITTARVEKDAIVPDDNVSQPLLCNPSGPVCDCEHFCLKKIEELRNLGWHGGGGLHSPSFFLLFTE